MEYASVSIFLSKHWLTISECALDLITHKSQLIDCVALGTEANIEVWTKYLNGINRNWATETKQKQSKISLLINYVDGPNLSIELILTFKHTKPDARTHYWLLNADATNWHLISFYWKTVNELNGKYLNILDWFTRIETCVWLTGTSGYACVGFHSCEQSVKATLEYTQRERDVHMCALCSIYK